PAARPAVRGERRIDDGEPPLGPSCQVPTRTYLAVGISVHGRRGQVSRQASVPLAPAPAALPQPAVKYDERGVTVAWQTAASPAPGEPTGPRLTSRPIGC